jgi:hypothetical protein
MYKALFIIFVLLPALTIMHLVVASAPHIQVALSHIHILP